ncbi:MAG: type II secretion system F family protein [Arcobacter sp.]|nr:MAG: type II secretion system F family protein [Arcobacter sp.]
MKYKIVYQEDEIIKSKIIDTLCIENEILPQNTIEIKKQFLSSNITLFENKYIKEKDLKSIFYELSLMLDSKILFDDAIKILIKNKKGKHVKEFLTVLQNSFVKSQDIEKSLKLFKISPLIISFFKITQNTGNVALNIKSLSEIINENYEIKKEFKKIMIYPMVLLITFFSSLIGIFKFVVPKFEFMFSNSKMELSFATKVLFFTKDIFENYLFFLLTGLSIFIFSLIYLYKNNQSLKYKVDKILVKNIYLLSDIYRLKTLYSYFVVVDILLKSKHEFHESIVKSKVLINNKYLLDRITQIENLLKSGKSVSSAFESTKLFDDITISLINTGEITNSLDVIINEIKIVYKKRFDEKLKLFSLLIEPVFLVFMMALIVWIVLAVFVPLWSIGDMLKV